VVDAVEGVKLVVEAEVGDSRRTLSWRVEVVLLWPLLLGGVGSGIARS
jgi:hypothetical protein